MQISNKKILILGGSGFIGKSLVNYFSKKNIITATYYSNKNRSTSVNWIKIDLTNIKDVKKIFKNKYDVVINCAAVTAGAKSMIESPFDFITANAVMNSNIIREVTINKVGHFIFLSCTVMYHNSSKYLKELDFDYKKQFHKNYEGIANTKLYFENICNFFSKISSTKFSVVRHSNIYGPFDKFNSSKSHFMAALITKVCNNENKLIIWGNGKEKRDFLYVDDFVQGIDNLITKQKNKFSLYNMSYGKSFSVKKIVNKVIKLSKVKKNIFYDIKKPTIQIDILVNSHKIKKEIGWYPKNKIDLGIKKTLEWYIKNY